MAEELSLMECFEWGNALMITIPEEGNRVAYPACEADCKVFVKDCQVRMKSFVYEDNDPGKL